MKTEQKKIIIAVQGGVMTGAFCSEPGFEVELWDFDNLVEQEGVDSDYADDAFYDAIHGMKELPTGGPDAADLRRGAA